jgi:AcrR family transcriptional regulator
VPRPKSLTDTELAAAALAVIDRAGLAALTMRAVATELRMSTMGLYRYVSDRGQLEGLVLDLVLATVDPTPPARASWQRRIIVLVERVYAVVSAHPAVVPLLLTSRHRSMAVVGWGETVLRVLTDAGLSGKPRVIAFRALVAYVIGAIQAEHLGPLSGPGTAALAALSPDDYPAITANATLASTMTADEEFRGGLAMVLRGISASAGA